MIFLQCHLVWNLAFNLDTILGLSPNNAGVTALGTLLLATSTKTYNFLPYLYSNLQKRIKITHFDRHRVLLHQQRDSQRAIS